MISNISTSHEIHATPPGDLAIWFFIFAELLAFGIFFVAYAFARAHNVDLFNESQQHLNRTSGAINTLVLITSSYFMVRAVAAIKQGLTRECTRWIAAAIGLAGTAARDSGVRSAGTIRRNINELLRNAMSKP